MPRHFAYKRRVYYLFIVIIIIIIITITIFNPSVLNYRGKK